MQMTISEWSSYTLIFQLVCGKILTFQVSRMKLSVSQMTWGICLKPTGKNKSKAYQNMQDQLKNDKLTYRYCTS